MQRFLLTIAALATALVPHVTDAHGSGLQLVVPHPNGHDVGCVAYVHAPPLQVPGVAYTARVEGPEQ